MCTSTSGRAEHRARVAERVAVVRERRRVQHDGGRSRPRRAASPASPARSRSAGPRRPARAASPARCTPGPGRRSRGRAVDLGLAGAEPAEVRAVQHQHAARGPAMLAPVQSGRSGPVGCDLGERRGQQGRVRRGQDRGSGDPVQDARTAAGLPATSCPPSSPRAAGPSGAAVRRGQPDELEHRPVPVGGGLVEPSGEPGQLGDEHHARPRRPLRAASGSARRCSIACPSVWP